jgi:hypothetical protein
VVDRAREGWIEIQCGWLWTLDLLDMLTPCALFKHNGNVNDFSVIVVRMC